ncbi:diuretic hormone 41 isoform X3 [Bicyclus anynana]|uniref:Diuretic hormone 41 isoform X3 n=1 Tax=Bicyclus anynana TaxID=110368 RepID=A0ABM3LDU8_BICAN|nr:diuretic hormone 41 isoform X3 [Bicyclus anynana]
MMWWAVCCAAVVASALVEAAPASNALASAIDWEQLDSSSPDDESLGYAASSMAGRNYAGSSPWLYLLTEVPRDSQDERFKRRMPSLSIDMPMSVLRQKLSLENERKMQAFRAAANRNYLNDIGKRGSAWSPSVDVVRY